MKANVLYKLSNALLIACVMMSNSSFAQPAYSFTNSTLIAGTDRQVNAQYRFLNVRAGVDAKVTIVAITGGITLQSFDNNSGGFNEALQPTIDIPASSSGYVELKVDFFVAGTNLTTPMVQTEVPITPIDVDGQDYGSGKVNEFDLVYMPNGYYMFDGLGGQLNITRPYGGWWVQGTNIATIDYAGIDTVQKAVMYSVMNATVSTIIFRVGGTNTSNATKNRLRSVYFRKFNYPNPVLPITDLRLFTGNSSGNSVKLRWELANEHSTSSIELQKSTDGINFNTQAVFLASPGTMKYEYCDNGLPSKVFYRLITLSNKGFETTSNILTFKPDLLTQNGIKVYPTAVQSSFTATMQSDKTESGMMEITDVNGRVVKRQPVRLLPGSNSFQVYEMEKINAGYYYVIVRKPSGNFQTMFLKQ